MAFSFPVMLAIVYWMWKNKAQHSVFWKNIVMPGAVFILIVGAWMAYYNWRGTGDPLLMPYVSNLKQYHITTPFLWDLRQPIPAYHHATMEFAYRAWDLSRYFALLEPGGLFLQEKEKLIQFYWYFLAPFGSLYALGMFGMLRSRRMLVPLVCLAMLILALLGESWPFLMHYGGPGLCVTYLMLLQGLRRLFLNRGRVNKLRPAFATLCIFAMFSLDGGDTMAAMLNPEYLQRNRPDQFIRFKLERERIKNTLEGMPGKHLVFVRYRTVALQMWDWVYNGADLKEGKILWVRTISPELDRSLAKAFPGRKVWVVDPDDLPPRLYPYDEVADKMGSSAPLNMAYPLKNLSQKVKSDTW